MDFCLLLKISSEISVSKNLSSKYRRKPDHAKQSATDVLKTALKKKAIQKTAEPTVDLIGDKIANNLTKVSINSP